ncbi:MAG: hypothetical protein A2744_03990 [Candidatus Buchananbacteria bacterium RIFCSPHIGHO2_01_FULL_44_11]|uniref:Phosphoglycerate mutase n=1 Tax=Candidatus Buchananbacteria bacterium RIFCSPHIGHO2_01_FULL_44_11 TaxID=1797535 RepID=A0A1G1Y3B6_9BACT|nr:MAG: hypothetical protein A2744_03990 [Candidatus Buchananbacteria bacterium RIFCSPHIGHO2_01_FULL_44_11]
MKIYFATHATSTDNENGLASGWSDPKLSALGQKQAKALASYFENIPLDLICVSDLKRAQQTVRLAFGAKFPVLFDSRLREINYGDYTGRPAAEVDSLRLEMIDKPFPGGESYQQAMTRLHQFYRELKEAHSEKTVLIIGHRATQYGLDTLVLGKDLVQVIRPLVWQPYWEYDF